MSDGTLAEDRNAQLRRDNRVLLAKLGVIVVAMFGFGYALVPFYEKICEVTGLRDIDKADAVFALTQGDNRNLMAAQIAKQIFGVKRVIAKVNDPIRAALYRAHEISTVSRTTILGTLLEAMLMGDAEVGKVLLEKSKQSEAAMAGEIG